MVKKFYHKNEEWKKMLEKIKRIMVTLLVVKNFLLKTQRNFMNCWMLNSSIALQPLSSK